MSLSTVLLGARASGCRADRARVGQGPASRGRPRLERHCDQGPDDGRAAAGDCSGPPDPEPVARGGGRDPHRQRRDRLRVPGGHALLGLRRARAAGIRRDDAGREPAPSPRRWESSPLLPGGPGAHRDPVHHRLRDRPPDRVLAHAPVRPATACGRRPEDVGRVDPREPPPWDPYAATLSFRTSVVFLGLLAAGSADVGEYGAAYRLVEATLFIAASFNAAALPWFSGRRRAVAASRSPAASRWRSRPYSRWSCRSPGMSLFAEPLIETLYGPEYEGADHAALGARAVVVLWGVKTTIVTVLVAGTGRRLHRSGARLRSSRRLLSLILIPPHGSARAPLSRPRRAADGARRLVVPRTVRLFGSISFARVLGRCGWRGRRDGGDHGGARGHPLGPGGDRVAGGLRRGLLRARAVFSPATSPSIRRSPAGRARPGAP